MYYNIVFHILSLSYFVVSNRSQSSKVSSYVTKKMSEKLKKGKSPSFTIISKIDDPDAIGAERVALYGCKFDKMILTDWERKKIGEESYSFTFEDWDLLDTTK